MVAVYGCRTVAVYGETGQDETKSLERLRKRLACTLRCIFFETPAKACNKSHFTECNEITLQKSM